MFKVYLIMLSILLFNPVQAAELFDLNARSVRALGMGNAYITVVRDADSMFYNPAGLARVGGINWTVFDVVAGVSGLEAFEKMQGVQEDGSFASSIRELYGEHVWAGAHAKSALTLPFISAAVYDSFDASMAVHDPAIPELHVNVVNDFGYALGFGAAIAPMVHLGVVAKRIKRTGSRAPYGASFIGSLNADAITAGIETEGTGYGLDVGLNLAVPGPIAPTVGFVWKNVGGTKFNPATTGGAAPPTEEDEMAMGVSVNIDAMLVEVTPSLDFRYLNRTDVDMTKKINFGLELDLPLLDIRAGYHQGYLSYGAGLGLGLLRIDLASYGVELGEKAGQLEDRRYVLQLTLELGFDLGLNFTGAGDGGNGSRGGLFGGGAKSLKRRR